MSLETSNLFAGPPCDLEIAELEALNLKPVINLKKKLVDSARKDCGSVLEITPKISVANNFDTQEEPQ